MSIQRAAGLLPGVSVLLKSPLKESLHREAGNPCGLSVTATHCETSLTLPRCFCHIAYLCHTFLSYVQTGGTSRPLSCLHYHLCLSNWRLQVALVEKTNTSLGF